MSDFHRSSDPIAHGGMASLHRGPTTASQTVPSLTEQAQRATERLDDPQHAAGIAAAMQRAQRYVAELNYREHGGAGPQRSPEEQAEVEALPRMVAERARAAEQSAAQAEQARAGRDRDELAALADADLARELRTGPRPAPAQPRPQPATVAQPDWLAALEPAVERAYAEAAPRIEALFRLAAELDADRGAGDQLAAKRQAAVERAQSYNADGARR